MVHRHQILTRTSSVVSHPAAAAGGYLALALLTTWPLARVLPRQIAGDLGDPLLNAWILLWTSASVLGALRGDLSSLTRYWHGNIFHPAPLTLAYSEHLTPQMLQALPVIAVTHNAVLAYNLVILATVVLSGLGTYLLVREMTGQPLAAFLAGVAFAFAPYRVDQWSHIEVLSSQWMPFALYGFRRFFASGRLLALAGGTAALVVQALSCAYYMAYFTPFAVAYCLYEMKVRDLIRDRRTWIALVTAAGAALLVMSSFLWPYLQVRRTTNTGVRDITEIEQLSADTHGFATISGSARLWGRRVRAFPRNEDQGFPGFTILVFAVIGIGAAAWRGIADARTDSPRTARWRTWLGWCLVALLAVQLALLLRLLVTGAGTVSILGVVLRSRYRPLRVAFGIAAVVTALFAVWPLGRRVAGRVHRDPSVFFAWGAIVAAAFALGPTVFAGGRRLGPGPYQLYLSYVPGFNGLRVASLHFMIVALFLAILAGLGAAAIRWSRVYRVVTIGAMLAMLIESWAVPVDTHAPPQVVVSGASADVIPLYQWIRDLPAGAVIAEFPFGRAFDEAGYEFAAGYHRKPLVNGYSGFEPPHYQRVRSVLKDSSASADAWAALLASGATHVVVHEAMFARPSDGPRLSEWLQTAGARQVAVFDADRVFRLPAR